MSKQLIITSEKLAWLDQCEPIHAVDIRNLGVSAEDNLDAETIEDLLDLFEGVDADGVAL